MRRRRLICDRNGLRPVPAISRPTSPPTPIAEITVAAVTLPTPRSTANRLMCTNGTNTTVNDSAYITKICQYTRVRIATAGASPNSCDAGTVDAIPSGCWPIDSGSRSMRVDAATMMTPPMIAIVRKAARQPQASIITAARGGTRMLARLPPAVVSASARPRRWTNHRTTVALQGTHDALIPIGATIPSPIKTIQSDDEPAQSR